MSKRSIFEEVSEPQKPTHTAKAGLIEKDTGHARLLIRIWLGLLFVLVVAMIFVGGLTRLTDSGLSITEWRPFTGALPPMNQADWLVEFEKYKAIDQYQIMNQWMELSDFKNIYWWEWGHRQLGRVTGLVALVGFIGFLVTRVIPTGWTVRLFVPGVLIGLQGAIGWWMVHSGVTQGEGMTAVASYRLATHLGLAFIILGVLYWYMLGLIRPDRELLQARRLKEPKIYGLSTGLLHFAFVQIVLGALVAGIDAGRSYTDWPLMGGQILPPSVWIVELGWKNLFENPGLVQFIHRVTGYLLCVFGCLTWLRGRRSAHPKTRAAFNLVFATLCLQVLLGIVTVLHGAPVNLASLHQLVAVGLWVTILRARFLSAYPIATSLKGN